MSFIGVEEEQETSATPPKKNPRSAPEGDIQSAVSAVEEWSREQCMQLNADKCKEMIIDFKNNKHQSH